MERNLGNEFDVTGTVKVSSPEAVQAAVSGVLRQVYPDIDLARVRQAFVDFGRLFEGELPGYRGCDTLYHDIQHTLDMTLAMARLVGGYERAVEDGESLGQERAFVGLVTALFHDSGYIRHHDDEVEHGAEYTQTHVSRSARLIERYLTDIGMGHVAAAGGRIVHFTGYEIPPEEIELEDRKHRIVGELLGTADLMAQMADRCYLEKCRDRLFPEFVLGGLVVQADGAGQRSLRYRSGLDLLRDTPKFFERIFAERLDSSFKSSYRYFESWFEGRNPYLEGIQKNLAFLGRVLQGEDWELLRRKPPQLSSHAGTAEDTERLAVLRLRELLESEGKAG